MTLQRVTVFTTMLAGLLLIMHTNLVEMRTDSQDRFCSAVCWEENARAEECERIKGCDIVRQPYRQFMRCSRPCQRETASCQMMCRNNFDSVFDQCEQECTGGNDHRHCMFGCFVDKALRLKATIVRTQEGRRGNRRGPGPSIVPEPPTPEEPPMPEEPPAPTTNE